MPARTRRPSFRRRRLARRFGLKASRSRFARSRRVPSRFGRVRGAPTVVATERGAGVQTKPIYWHRPMGMEPMRMRTQLAYAESEIPLAPGYYYGSYVFSANDIYDPNVTGGGHQPDFHDALATLYNNYICVGSKLYLEVHNTAVQAVEVGVFCVPSALGSLTSGQIRQRANKSAIVARNGDEGDTCVIELSFSPKDILPPGTADSTTAAAFGSQPAQRVFYDIHFASPDASTLLSLRFNVQIVYDVICCNPKFARTMD